MRTANVAWNSGFELIEALDVCPLKPVLTLFFGGFLIPPDDFLPPLLGPPVPTEPGVTIDEFFQLYNDLFYEIPKLGETNSHEYLIKQSSDYVGSTILTDDIQALLDEITALREENLELQRNIIDLTTNTNSWLWLL